MKIWNLTPHDINVVSPECVTFRSDLRKNVADAETMKIIATIPSDGLCSAKLNTAPGTPVEGIPVFEKSVGGCDPLPAEFKNGEDIAVVSALYATAYRKVYGATDGLYTVADPVYSEDGKTILGSLGICPAF